MSLNAATIQFLLEKGLTGEDLLVVAQSLEHDGARSKAAERQARYRDKKKAESVTGDVTNDVTGDVTHPPKDNSKPPSSEPNGSGGAAADPVKELFDLGVSILTATGQTEKQARSLIGKWRKAKGDGEVLTGLIDSRGKSNPVEWLEKRFKGVSYTSESGYQYRGDRDAVKREAERRHDMGTYWKIIGEENREQQERQARV